MFCFTPGKLQSVKKYSETTKNVQIFMCSQGPQNLKEISSPQTKQCINAYRKSSKEKKRAANNKQNNQQENEQNRKNKKPSRSSSLDVSEFLVENNIKSETEPFAMADEQKKAGKKRSFKFCFTSLNERIENT